MTWQGFTNLGTKVPGGYEYKCDGMSTLMGCGASITITREFRRVGKKSTGWLVCYGLEPNSSTSDMTDRSQLHEDKDVVLTFCPSCAAVVEAQP